MLSDYTEDQIRDIIKSCNTIQELAVYLGYSEKRSGKTLAKISGYIKKNNISTEYFINVNTLRKKLTKDKIFFKGSCVSNTTVKNRILESDLIKYECVLCSNGGFHNGQPLTLQLDHIDGDNKNNEIQNLRFLCPNCHSQTLTFGGRNKSAPSG